jgi:glycosyltransferase involved in cell wall biosynthesis
VLQFADIINRHDFIDVIVQNADHERFEVGTCVRSRESNIAAPSTGSGALRWILDGTTRTALPRVTWRLARLLRRWNADIVHSHHYDQAVIGWLATRLHRRTRHVVGRHYSDAIYRLPHGPRRRALLSIEQAVNRAATRIVVPSAFIRELLVTRQGVPTHKIDVIPYAFEPQKYTPPSSLETLQLRRQLGLDGCLVLGTFARLHEEKGHRFLLQAFSDVATRRPRLRLVLVGEGPERKAIEHQLGALGLQGRVQLLGWRRDALALMAAVDVVVQPTLQEAFSQVMVEALWMRRPLVMTDVSGTAEVVRDGENALLVPRGESQALARAIERLVTDEGLRSRLASAGREYVKTNLSLGSIIPRYEQSYLRALDEHEGGRGPLVKWASRSKAELPG